MKTLSFSDVDTYIESFPKETQKLLNQMRETIKKTAPQAKELISYNMPAYKLDGMLVYFAAFKNHIGFYPTAIGIKAFSEELSIYKNAKGSVQFPLTKPLPLALIAKIVKLRVQENVSKTNLKKNLRTCSKGHTYYKSSDCPTCPVCEATRKPKDDFLTLLVAPARRALENNGITTLKQLANFSETAILKFHGMGPSTIPKLRLALKEAGLSFKK